jgi:hypothetical protein
MSFTVQNKVFGGKYTDKIVGDLIANNTLQAALGFPVIDGIKEKYVWSDIKQNIVLNVSSTKPINPSDNSTQVYNENVGIVCNYEASNVIPMDIFNGTYREQQMALGSQVQQPNDDTVIFEIILNQLRGKVQEKISERLLYLDSSYEEVVCSDGLTVQFRDTSLFRPVPTSQKITGSTAISNPNTVTVELDKIIAALPSKVKHRLDGSGRKAFKLAVHSSIFDALESKLAANDFVNTAIRYGVDEETNVAYLAYRGYKIYAIEGMKPNEAFLMDPVNNGAILVDSDNDSSSLVVTNDYLTQRKATLSWRMDFRMAIMFGNGDEIVYYSPTL